MRVEVTLDVKMPGDHVDAEALARCELRRDARWVNLLAALRTAKEASSGPPPDPRDYGTWVVAPYVPLWLRESSRAGVLTLERVAPGCWRVGPGIHETLWIAANELPLRGDLVPFLVARSGRALVEFLLWSATVKGPLWTRAVVMELGMSVEVADEVINVPTDEAEQYRIKTAFTRKLLQFYPEAANEMIEEGVEKAVEQTLSRQFERRLGRALSAAEHASLARRIHTLGAAAVSDVVVDLAPDALDAWLRGEAM